MIPQDIIDKILETANIQDIVGEFVSLKKKGVNYIGNCPFHNEKTPSFIVSPSKGIYKCFGCGAGGNVIKFIQEHEKLSYPQAIKYVGRQSGVNVPEQKQTPEQKEEADKREGYFIVNKLALEFFQKQLADSEALHYMQSRGFGVDDLKNFDIGYAPNSWTDFLTYATQKGYTPEQLHQAGLLGKKDGGRYYDRFVNRAIFPIKNITGNVVGFTGRVLGSSDMAKYLNTPETDYFKKGNLLYGLSQAKRFMSQQGFAILVEGNTDVMRWHQLGLHNTVATCGTALTKYHARLIRRFTNNITIVFDGDKAGKKAAERGIPICVAEGLAVSVALLPEGEDPDSFGQKMSKEQLEKWLEDNSKDFITFRAEAAKTEIANKPTEKGKLINELLEIVKSVPDLATREMYFDQVAEVLTINRSKFANGVLDFKDEELFGFEAAQKAIKENGELILCNNKDNVMGYVNNDTYNVAAFTGKKLSAKQVGLIYDSTKNIVLDYDLPYTWLNDKEPEEVKQIKNLVEKGFNVKMDYKNEERASFIDFYFAAVAENAPVFDAQERAKFIEKAAEFLSKLDNSLIHAYSGTVAKRFEITKGDFNKILKPYLDRKKGTIAQKNESIVVDGTPHHYDIDNLPDYVDRKFLSKYKHFPVQNSDGTKIFYMFQTESGTLAKVGNFFMEPQFHVISDDPQKNKRIVKFNHAETGERRFAEVPSNDMVEFGSFKKYLWRLGQYFFTGGKSHHLDMILTSIATQFPVTYELEIFGQQPEGFYAFSNAIVVGKEVKYMNDLGLINYKDRTYYSPSVSIIHKDARQDNDSFKQQRTFTFKEGNANITFEKWSKLLIEVYKYNNNGHWALLMAILSAFRSEIFPIGRLFTTLFLTGPTECGKSQIAISIRSLFFDRDAPLFNLNSGTPASFFTILEKYRDAAIVMEEYNDMQIPDIVFQGLKAAVYDGEGKTKRKDATSRDLDQSEINAAPILLGQEAPERDDNSLQNRCIMCPVKKKDDWTEEERNNFIQLKDWEKQGLTHILVEILKLRPTIKRMYAKKLRICEKELQKDLQSNGLAFQTRILNTISLFLAMVKLFEEHVEELKLPFTYDEFYQIARKKLIDQSETITTSNRLSVFFEKLLTLTEDPRNGIRFGKEYKVELLDELLLRQGRDKFKNMHFEAPKKVLFVRLDQVHEKYRRLVGEDEYLKMNNLRNYLVDHPAFLGNVKSTLFRWEEEARVKSTEESEYAVSKMKTISKKTSAAVFDYELLGLDMGNQMFSHGQVNETSNEEAPTEWQQKTMEFEKGKGETVVKDTQDLPF